MHYPLYHGAEWELSEWNSSRKDPSALTSYCDSQEWTKMVIGNFTLSTAHTVYLRKQLTWSQKSAAYKLSLTYRYGIIVFMNGNEILRDNLPQGVIYKSTPATGGYEDYREQIYVRNSNEFGASTFSLCVELHWTQNDTESWKPIQVLFDAWLAELGKNPNSDCSFIPLSPVSIDNATDFSLSSFYEFSSNEGMYSHSLRDAYTINTLEFYSPTISCWMPQELTLYGVTRNKTCQKLIEVSNPIWTTSGWTQFSTFNQYKDIVWVELHVSSRNHPIRIWEFRLGICGNSTYPSFQYPNSPHFLTQDYIDLYPISSIYSHCTSLATFPAGIELNYSDCHISGYYQGKSIAVELPIVAEFPIHSVTLVSLVIESCNSTVLLIKRVYGSSNAFYESLKLTDTYSNYNVFEIPAYSTQEPNATFTWYVCTNASILRVEMNSKVAQWWDSNSYVEFWLHTDLQNIFLLQTRYDERSNGNPDHFLSLEIPIMAGSQWRYHYGTIIANWNGIHFDDSNWNCSRVNQFPDSPNQLQFYRNTFYLNSLNEFIGFQLHLRCQYCFKIYVNGFLVQYYGISSIITEQTTCELQFDQVKYRSIMLTVCDYLQLGANVVSIVIVSPSEITRSSFDCIVQMIATDAGSRAMPLKQVLTESRMSQSTQVIRNASLVFDGDMSTGIRITSCDPVEIEIEFSDNRCEFFNELVLYSADDGLLRSLSQFILDGRNAVNDSWERLMKMESLGWIYSGQSKIIPVYLPQCYRFFRFTNMSQKSQSICDWSLLEIMFLLVHHIENDVLEYPIAFVPHSDPIVPLRPRQVGFSNYVAQGLPSGVYIDSASGAIYGSSLSSAEVRVIVTAEKAGYIPISTRFNLSFLTCDLDVFMLLDIHVLTFSTPHSFTLRVLTTSSVDLLRPIVQFTTGNDEFVYRLCVLPQSYSIQIESDPENQKDRIWIAVNHVTLIQGSFNHEGKYVFDLDATFEAIGGHSIWTMLSTDTIPFDWNMDAFDDSMWQRTNMDGFQSDTITVYFRRTVTIQQQDLELLMHVQMQFEGGIVAYMHGMKIALFNLPSSFDSTTYASSLHNYTKIETFSVNLVQSFVYPGTHVFSLEYHNARTTSLPTSCISVTIVTLREENTHYRNSMTCSIVREGKTVPIYWRDPITPFFSSSPFEQALNEEFPTTSIHLPLYFFPQSYIQLTPNNQVRMRPQGIHLILEQSISMTILLEGLTEEKWMRISLFNSSSEEVNKSLPQLLLGYSSFRMTFTTTEAVLMTRIVELSFTFNSHASLRCPAVDSFLPAWDLDVSVIPCPENYTGYQYRRCMNGRFQKISLEECIMNEPSHLIYPQQVVRLLVPIDTISFTPSVQGVVNQFSIAPSLPDWFSLDPNTGILEGTAMSPFDSQVFTITAENENGVTSFFLTLSIEELQCSAEDDWPNAKTDSVTFISCPDNQTMFGIRIRYCVTMDREGIWSEEYSYCYSKNEVVSFLMFGSIIVSCIVSLVSQLIRKTKK